MNFEYLSPVVIIPTLGQRFFHAISPKSSKPHQPCGPGIQWNHCNQFDYDFSVYDEHLDDTIIIEQTYMICMILFFVGIVDFTVDFPSIMSIRLYNLQGNHIPQATAFWNPFGYGHMGVLGPLIKITLNNKGVMKQALPSLCTMAT